ncbi:MULTISPECIES: hypothetical protein [Salipiger]|uniref:Uncharacterized protein n=1 Tax=Salipiger profundus TaxID=1229727 RepID=A0A1U7D0V8_9RHOB|nr:MULTISPECIES: hypothetical protein [Salipiger]APX21733.1 hypothetical protein Ga0080559_TMP937 [Salipiger profundus]
MPQKSRKHFRPRGWWILPGIALSLCAWPLIVWWAVKTVKGWL